MNKLIRNNMIFVGVVLAVCLCAAWIPNQKVIDAVAYDLTVQNDATVADLTVSTTATLAILAVSNIIEETDIVALTSPTVTFSVAGMVDVVLSADANLTGAYPIGGTVGQVVSLRSAATGSNTIRVDDGAKTITGSNVTLTESEQDSITLRCITTPDVWVAIGAHQN